MIVIALINDCDIVLKIGGGGGGSIDPVTRTENRIHHSDDGCFGSGIAVFFLSVLALLLSFSLRSAALRCTGALAVAHSKLW